MSTTTAISKLVGPKPLIVVHLSTSILGTACGRVAGQRRYDPALGTFCQDSAHLTIRPNVAYEGTIVCSSCQSAGKVEVVTR